MRIQDSREYSASFDALDEQIADLRRAATPLPAQRPRNRTLVVGCSIAHAAAIQLHAPLAPTSADSKRKCVDAATAVLDVVAHADIEDAAYIDPIIAPVWSTACRIAMDELRTRRELGCAEALVAVFERALAAMRPFADSCALMSTLRRKLPLILLTLCRADCHIAKIQDAYDAV